MSTLSRHPIIFIYTFIYFVYLSVTVRDQSDGHDVLQHGPGREELLGDEDSAVRTQTLIVQSDRYWRNSLVWSDSIHLHTLLLNLHEEKKNKKKNKTITFDSKIISL